MSRQRHADRVKVGRNRWNEFVTAKERLDGTISTRRIYKELFLIVPCNAGKHGEPHRFRGQMQIIDKRRDRAHDIGCYLLPLVASENYAFPWEISLFCFPKLRSWDATISFRTRRSLRYRLSAKRIEWIPNKLATRRSFTNDVWLWVKVHARDILREFVWHEILLSGEIWQVFVFSCNLGRRV